MLGNYLKFYTAIKASYSDIGIISNCDGSYSPLDHPADFYDFHVSSHPYGGNLNKFVFGVAQMCVRCTQPLLVFNLNQE